MPKKITLYLIDDLPNGLRSINIGSWNGKAICSPRNSIKKIDKIEADKSACLYFLCSTSADGELRNIYVGETDVFSNRLQNHTYNKDWWDEIIVFYSPDGSLTKTEVKYLEFALIKVLKEAGKCNLMNGSTPALNNISKEDVSVMETFIDQVKLTLPLFGYDIFEQNIEIVKKHAIEVHSEGKGALAKGLFLQDGKLLVLKGSTAIKENSPAFNTHNYKKLKDKLIDIGRLIEEGEYLVFTDDYEFSSSSAAAAIILARSAQGPAEWKDQNGNTLANILVEKS